MALYDYEKQLSDLTDRYAQDDATSAYANFIGQQRFSRQREDNNKGFTRAFPQFTGQWARRLGSGIQSGVMGDKLNQFVGDYTQGQGRLNEDQAQQNSQYESQRTMANSSYQRALLALQEELQRQRATADPYAAYRGAYGGS